jgi:hypothetical protein
MSPTKEELLAWLDTAVGLMAEHTAWDDKNGQEYAALRALLTDPTDPERREMLSWFNVMDKFVKASLDSGTPQVHTETDKISDSIRALIAAPDKGEK